MADDPSALPCEQLPPLPQEEVKRGVEEERERAMRVDEDMDEAGGRLAPPAGQDPD